MLVIFSLTLMNTYSENNKGSFSKNIIKTPRIVLDNSYDQLTLTNPFIERTTILKHIAIKMQINQFDENGEKKEILIFTSHILPKGLTSALFTHLQNKLGV